MITPSSSLATKTEMYSLGAAEQATAEQPNPSSCNVRSSSCCCIFIKNVKCHNFFFIYQSHFNTLPISFIAATVCVLLVSINSTACFSIFFYFAPTTFSSSVFFIVLLYFSSLLIPPLYKAWLTTVAIHSITCLVKTKINSWVTNYDSPPSSWLISLH